MPEYDRGVRVRKLPPLQRKSGRIAGPFRLLDVSRPDTLVQDHRVRQAAKRRGGRYHSHAGEQPRALAGPWTYKGWRC